MFKRACVLRVIIVSIAVLSINIVFSQGVVLDVSMKERIDNSSYIIQGQVINKECRWNEEHNSIFTLNFIKIFDSLKNDIASDTIVVLTRGGVVDFDKQVDFPSLKLQIGDIGMFLLNKSKEKINGINKVFETSYLSLGMIKYDLERNQAFDDYTNYNNIDKDFFILLKELGLSPTLSSKYLNKNIHYRSPNAVSISSFSPTVSTAGTMTTITINGSGFEPAQGNGKVEFRNADNGGSGYMTPIQDEYESWSDTQIKVMIPSGAGTGDIRVTNNSGSSDVSSTDLIIDYNLTNINYNSVKYRPNLVDANGNGGIYFEFYTDFFNNADARDAFERALGTWRCSNYGGTGVYFADGGSSNVDVIANDGTNIVRFDNGNELPSNVLGRMTSRYSGCSSGGNPLKWYTKELDVVFNDVPGSSSYTWNFSEPDNTTASNQYDFESVAAHELGHGHQLGHVIDAAQMMHYSIGNGQEKRELSANDFDGGDDVLSFSTATCGKPEMSIFVCAVIPLKLLSFTSNRKKNGVYLEWEFENLFDLEKVVLQKSSDGIDFVEIESYYVDNIVLSDGNNSVFSYLDKSFISDNYYRLKIFDIDGTYFYSKKLYVFKDEKMLDGVSIFPNPADDYFTIDNYENDEIVVYLLNGSGRVVIDAIKIKGLSNKKIDISYLPKGFYLLKDVGSVGNVSKKIIKD